MDSYEIEIPLGERDPKMAHASMRDGDEHRHPGQPRNTRIKYLPHHPKAHSTRRILRSLGHRNLPNFIGCWFPRHDDEESKTFYCTPILALLKPWRSLADDLKQPGQTWEKAFDDFLKDTSWREKHVISGLQYFHECSSAAATHDSPESSLAQQLSQDVEDGYPEDGDWSLTNKWLSKEGLVEIKAALVSHHEELHGLLAIEVARRAKMFNNDMLSWSSAMAQRPRNATDNDLQTISSWVNQLQADIEKKNTRPPPPPSTLPVQPPSVDPITDSGSLTADISLLSHALVSSEEALDGIDISHLRPDQARAYGII